ncbi:MAG: hypothetical protein AMJ84_00160 [Acidithiobacillales bacterium SM23_46]|nr:MAG: hypothetical protein AMJ84_00160 [Acidithiobacillales bacterium SM23_46]KPL29031.1 MAG: hypothetical protein AMJ72_00290 [Acidithiobacillales bacterium SM1_46]
MPTKLTLYNGALSIIGERKLADLTENREPRYKLDDIWDNDLVRRVLQMGQWNFAKRTVELGSSPSVTPSFGYQYAFDKPADFVRTIMVAHDQYFNIPITRYSDEGAWIFCDQETIYFAYVSDDTQWGSDFTLWPPNFTEMVEHYLAYKVAPRITGMDFNERELERKWKTWLAEAKATDAMESPAKFPPKGGWARSRQGFRGGSRDRGNRGQLIG